MIREVEGSHAKTPLLRILDEVERGGTIIITRRGRRIARLIPEAERRQDEIDRAIESIRALRARTGLISSQELLASRHAGHKY